MRLTATCINITSKVYHRGNVEKAHATLRFKADARTNDIEVPVELFPNGQVTIDKEYTFKLIEDDQP